MSQEVVKINMEEEVKKKRSPANQKMIDDYVKTIEIKPSLPKVKVERKNNENVITTTAEDVLVNELALLNCFGTSSVAFSSYAMIELVNSTCKTSPTKQLCEQDVNGLLAAMHGINPQDEVEGMLASQMVATHFAAMRVMRQLQNSDSVMAQDSNGNLVNKLMRSYTAQMEALSRYRGKGQQKMTVEHVHVYEGGQAIVGQVTRTEGEGIITKTKEQPHAKQITHAPMPKMPSKNKKGKPMPIASNA
jgi:hypothetical protein